MDYTEYILQEQGISLGKSKTFVELYDLLSNQQDIQKVAKKILSTLSVTGAVSLIRYHDNRFTIVEEVGDTELIQKAFDDKSVLKEILSTKNAYHDDSEPLNKPYYCAIPILTKNNEFLGALCIHEKQEITCWKEIHVLTHFMAVVYNYYNLIETNNNLSTIDPITKLFNFRKMQNLLGLEVQKATRHHMPLSVVMINIDNFKTINKRLGTDGGDKVLYELGRWIKSNSRQVVDMPGRLEADTFAIILSNTPLKGAEIFLERLLVKINNKKININSKELKIRVRTSVLEFESHYTSDDFLQIAKRQLHKTPEEE